MSTHHSLSRAIALASGLSLAAAAGWAQAPASTPAPAKKKAAPAKTTPPPPRPTPETKAVDILKASCQKLAAAKTMSFRALGAYEVPSLWGPPLIYGRIYEVALQRPDRLRVITVADGPRTEFYDDGKVMMSFHPAENMVAVSDAPPTIEGALEKLFTISGTYFPFTDIVVADPWGDMQPGLTGAFYVGESQLIGGVTTDVVAYEDDGVFIQMWIGRDDRLPRMARAQFHDDPLQLRQSVQFTDWQLDPAVAPDAFTTPKAGAADKIAFNHPRMKPDTPAGAHPIGSGMKKKTPAQAAPKPTPASH